MMENKTRGFRNIYSHEISVSTRENQQYTRELYYL